MAASFFSSAGVGWPAASSATATGISLCSSCRSAAFGATAMMCMPRRRGDAKAVMRASAAARPCAFSESDKRAAKDSPSFFSALGGSSSTSSSTSRLRAVME
jgi:hypothetical protein